MIWKWEIYKGIINHHINNLITFMNTNMNNDNNVDNRKNVLNKRPKANLQKKQLQENLMSFIHLQTLSPLDSSWKNSYLNQSITTTLKFKRKDKIWEILIYHGQLSLEWIDRNSNNDNDNNNCNNNNNDDHSIADNKNDA